ncbi:MAG: C_GCAxxG_C_C family protein [Clostridia bacterium]|nr:C_GCAxxG_C_C family protein [Clostridia bacterium]
MNYTLPATIPTGRPTTDSPHALAALTYFENGCQCAQATFCAFEDLTGLPHATCMALSSSFGGGVSRIRGGCGALTGILMAAGLLLYPTFPKEQAKDDQYRLTQYMAALFKARMRSIYCRDLLGLPHAVEPPVSSKRTAQYYAERPCQYAVVAAAETLEQVLREAENGSLSAHLTDEQCAITTDFLNL